MELLNSPKKDEYLLTHGNNKYMIDYEHNPYEPAKDYGFYLFCNYVASRHDIIYKDIESLKGKDLIDNLSMTLDSYDSKELDIFSLYSIASKNKKLKLYADIHSSWEEWEYRIDIREYSNLLYKKLMENINISQVNNFVEESIQFIGFVIEFNLTNTINECVKETELLLLKLHNEIVELHYDNKSQSSINRSIEFEPEYYQAGLGILSYFGTVVREKYPDGNAKVKIEQNGYSVIMTIETEDGDKETIEKLLQNYELVVIGEKAPDTLFDTPLQILDLRTELRVAQVRIESQKELLQYANKELMDVKSLFKHALTQNNLPIINMDVSPNISIDMNQSTQVSISNNISEISSNLENIINNCDDNIIKAYLTDAINEINNITGIENKKEMKESSSLAKIKALVEDANKTGSSLNTFLNTVSDGFEIMQNIGKKYNAIAEWCLAPQIPSQFLK